MTQLQKPVIEVVPKVLPIEVAPCPKIAPRCKYFGKCGGCSFQDIPIQEQIKYKVAITKKAFSKKGIDIKDIKTVCQKEYGYRCRIQLHSGGFFAKGTNTPINITECPVCEPIIQDYLKNTANKRQPHSKIQIFASEFIKGPQKLVICTQTFQDFAGNKEPVIQGNTKRKLKLKKNTYFAGTLSGSPTVCTVCLLGKDISFDARGFFQSNLFMTQKTALLMQEAILQQFGEGCKINLLDMYCGCGTFSTLLSPLCRHTALVEHNRDSLVFAAQNLTQNKKDISCDFYGVSAASFAKQHYINATKKAGSFDAVVIDPPRTGMQKEVLQMLFEASPPLLLCLSCNIQTQANDISFLQRAGYKIKDFFLLDFFPQTPHIESLCILEKNNSTFA